MDRYLHPKDATILQEAWSRLATGWNYEKSMQAATIFATTCVAYLVALAIYRVWFHPMASVPGPLLYKISYLPYMYMTNITGTFAAKSPGLHKKYGSVVRVGPNHIVVDGSHAYSEVYNLRASKEFPKVRDFFTPDDRLLFINAAQETHRLQRRQLNHAFSDVALRQQEPTVAHYIDLFVDRMKTRAANNEIVDVVSWMNFITFDIIGDLAVSRPFKCLENNGYHPWVKSLFDGISGAAAARFWRHYPIVNTFVKGLGLSGRIKAQDAVRGFAHGLAIDRLAHKGDEQKDFTWYMLQENRDGNNGFTPETIIASTPTVILAGSETTATTLSGLYFFLSQNPDVKKKLFKEIRSAFQSDEDINFQTTSQLPYLHACLEETLRSYPPVAELPARVSPGAMVNDMFIPQGTIISTFQWATFRSEKFFAEPLSFRPERWLAKDHPLYNPIFDNDRKDVFKPFSAGSRDCIGKNLAYNEMRVVASRFIYGFEHEILPGQDDWLLDQRCFLVWQKKPLLMSFKTRDMSVAS